MTITIATWNIAGGRPIKSEEKFDYGTEDIGLFADKLKVLSPDVVCFQETHIGNGRSVAREIAEAIGGYHVEEVAMSPSHIDERYKLGNAIISRVIPLEAEHIMYPYPEFPLFFPNGKPAARHDKGFQQIRLSFGQVINTHAQPIGYFGTSYDSPAGKHFAGQVEKLLIEHRSFPVLFAGDLNYHGNVAQLYPIFLKEMRNALPDRPTRSDGKITDHIFYSKEFELKESGIIETQTDHFLCWATLEIA